MFPKIFCRLKNIIRKVKIKRPFFCGVFIAKIIRVGVLSLKNFHKGRSLLQASALAYYSLLSIVPILAMAFGIAKGFNLDLVLEKEILNKAYGQKEFVQKSITFAKNLLENAKGEIIAGIGALFLFWTIVKVLGHVENAFNDIWRIKEGRSLSRKCSDYLSISLMAPILLVSANGAVILLHNEAHFFSEKFLASYGEWNIFFLKIIDFLPYCMIWILLAFLYLCMPNTKVHFSSACIAAIIAGSLYQVFQWAMIYFQVGILHYGAIYGSFASLPLFLIWLQISWLIVLFGSEISFAHQNLKKIGDKNLKKNINIAQEKLFSLQIVSLVANNFIKGKKALSTEEIFQKTKIPLPILEKVLFRLLASEILSKTLRKKKEAYQPARDIHRLKIYDIIYAIEHREEEIIFEESENYRLCSAALEEFEEKLHHSPLNIEVKNLQS